VAEEEAAPELWLGGQGVKGVRDETHTAHDALGVVHKRQHVHPRLHHTAEESFNLFTLVKE
jgi:hypothetical protein